MTEEEESGYPEATVLIVDDEKNTREGLRRSLEEMFDVYVAADVAGALEVIQGDRIDVMVTDLRLGGEDGMELIDRALKMPQAPICIMMTAYGSVDTAVEAMKRGAYDYVSKPLNIDELELLIKRALRSRHLETENRSLKRQVETRLSVGNILGKSVSMQPVFDMIRQVAPTRATVLIEGESGTGKELVAKAIHIHSGRPKAKMVTVHCAGLNKNVMESELFGHEKGAFTDARTQRTGYFEEADGGTLFLDEIGDIDAPTQVKLLRALGEKTIQRVGSSRPIEIDVRLITATNRNLKEMVEQGSFREDLYYRLDVVKISMPPLRERREDIVLLAGAFLKEFAEENGKPVREISSEAMTSLLDYDWPGNVRELRTVIEHGVVMCQGDKVTVKHLPQSMRGGNRNDRGEMAALGTTLSRGGGKREESDLNLARIEEQLIHRALERTRGNRTEAAELLGLSRRTLQRRLKELGMMKEEG